VQRKRGGGERHRGCDDPQSEEEVVRETAEEPQVERRPCFGDAPDNAGCADKHNDDERKVDESLVAVDPFRGCLQQADPCRPFLGHCCLVAGSRGVTTACVCMCVYVCVAAIAE